MGISSVKLSPGNWLEFFSLQSLTLNYSLRSGTIPLVFKSAIIHPRVRETLRSFPEEVRKAFGKAIHELQKGIKLEFPLSRPMPSVEKGVEELRIKDRAGAYRVFCFSRSTRGLFVFHAFVKKTDKTPKQEIDLGKKRLREMLNEKI
jgi:phage-related protein